MKVLFDTNLWISFMIGKRLATLAVGSTLITTADILQYNSDLDRVKGHHYHPGLYVSGSVDFRF